MTTITKLKRKTSRGSAVKISGHVPSPEMVAEIVKHQDSVREFILAMTIELSELAYKNDLDPLAVALDMAREVAEMLRAGSDGYLQRP